MTEKETGDGEVVALVVDDTVCIGIGRCEMLEPDAFFINDEAISEVDGSKRFTKARAEEIVMECPSGAISIQPTDAE